MTKYNTCGYCNKEYNKNDDGAGYKYCSKECVRNIRNERRRQNNKPYEKVTLECEWCKEEYQVLKRYAYQSQYCSDKCGQERYSREVRGNIPLDEMERIWEEQSRLTKQRDEKRKAVNRFKRSLNKVVKYHEEVERVQGLTRRCVECDSMFYHPQPNALTCSDGCGRRRRNRRSKLYNSTRLNEDNIVDDDITLERLYERDKGVCYLCGGECSYEDVTITDEGYYIAGETHPSIDHVKPISKGGKHSWNNVKLSCMYCNTIKSDSIIDTTQETLA